MNVQDLNNLANIYNALRTVQTCDKSTIMMGKCLEAFEEFLSEKQEEFQQSLKEQKETNNQKEE